MPNIRLYAVLGVLCVFNCLSTNAQQDLDIETISTDHGLSQGAIFDILQDREGFLWIGTKDGLNRYDGHHFEVFTNDPDDPWSISGNTVGHLFEDSAGRIWAASDNAGINIYDKKTGRFHHIPHDPQNPASLSGNYISAIVEDTSGVFVIGIAGREINIFRLEDEFFRLQKAPQIIRMPMPIQKRMKEIPNSDLRGMVKDAKGCIWVGGENSIYRLNVQQAQLTLAIEGYSFGTAYTNPDGSFWAGGGSHDLFYWDGTNASTFIESFNGVCDIRVDEHENMWVAWIDTLYGFDIAGWRPGAPIGLDSDRCFFRWKPGNSGQDIPYPFKSMTIDRSGIVWAGTNGYGLYKINPNRMRFSHHLRGISIRQIVVTSKSEIFLQNYSNEFLRQDGTYLDIAPFRNIDENTDFMLVTKSGEYWTRYLFQEKNDFNFKRYNPRTNETWLYDIGWHHWDSQPMIECQDGSIWMAGWNDVLTHVDPLTGTVISYNLKDGKSISTTDVDKRKYSQEFSTALYEDSDGVLWVGTELGFTKFIRPSLPGKALQLTKYKNIPGDRNSLSYNHVMCFLDDPVSPGRYLWVCTKGGGVNRMDKISGTFMRLTKKDGLPDNVVYGILSDKEGNLWGSTNKGIFCMSQNKHVASEENPEGRTEYIFRNFSKADGLQDNEFNTGAFAKLPDGRLVFGGINGYNVFDPKEVLSADYNPSTFITNILVNNQQVSPGDETGILENTIEWTQKITLTHLQDILTLEFASLDFSAPDRNKYRYQLVGADDSWVEAGNHRSATFLHLRPKDYTFRVQGSNSQGIWSDHIAELGIRVLPPWWKTWWAYLIYSALIASAIWTYLQFSIKRAKLRQQLAFEKREADRVRELDALKTQLYMNMTHEFRTPLTIILGMAQQVLENPKEHLSGGLDMIIRNGQSLLSLVNKMLNLSKLESGKMTLELVQGDVVLFLKNIVESFRSFAANKEIQLHFLPEVDAVIMDFDADKLQQVVSNLISNAFKFTPEGGNIYFGLRKENASVTIRVKDTGRGITKKDLHKIFDRFYQVDNSITRQYEGTGIGMALSKELVKLMNGEISVQSPPAGATKGSEFMVALPIRQEAAVAVADVEAASFEEIEMVKTEDEPSVPAANGTEVESIDAPQAPVIQRLKDTDKPLILLVEDNADVVTYVASCLPDYRLAVAENGQEGFEIATEIIPDLIISDVMMPVMDGFELCRRLKSDKRTDHIPVIMLTARADLDSKLEGLELGANAYLPKPYEKQELLLNIKNLFELRDKLRQHYQNIAGLAEHGEFDGANSDASKPEDAFVIKVREIIEAHIEDFDFNIEQLAKDMYLSHSQLGRKLDALTGFSPSRFIRFIRLKKAKELLQEPDLSIIAIAYDCGFHDPNYFSRVFKTEFGKTPVEWRAQATLKSS